jgi:hypothetical protein
VISLFRPPRYILQLLRALFGPFIVNLGYPDLDLLDIDIYYNFWEPYLDLQTNKNETKCCFTILQWFTMVYNVSWYHKFTIKGPNRDLRSCNKYLGGLNKDIPSLL